LYSSKLGSGIAVDFFATVYGVSSDNLQLLPIGSELKIQRQNAVSAKEMLLEVVLGILEGVNPRIIEDKLTGYVPHHERKGENAAAGEKTRVQADAVSPAS